MEPLHPYGRSQFLHAAGETPSAVVALDGGFARVGPHEHLGHQPLGQRRRAQRVDHHHAPCLRWRRAKPGIQRRLLIHPELIAPFRQFARRDG